MFVYFQLLLVAMLIITASSSVCGCCKKNHQRRRITRNRPPSNASKVNSKKPVYRQLAEPQAAMKSTIDTNPEAVVQGQRSMPPDEKVKQIKAKSKNGTAEILESNFAHYKPLIGKGSVVKLNCSKYALETDYPLAKEVDAESKDGTAEILESNFAHYKPLIGEGSVVKLNCSKYALETNYPLAKEGDASQLREKKHTILKEYKLHAKSARNKGVRAKFGTPSKSAGSSGPRITSTQSVELTTTT